MLEPPKNFRIVVVAGLPGVGKSTVLSRTSELLKAEGYLPEVINYGDFMFEFAKRKSVKSRDDLRKLPLNEQKKLQASVAKEIRSYVINKASNDVATFIAFIDTHVLIKTSSGLWPGLPEYVIKELVPDSIVIVEASPEEIVSRQLRDKTRYRADYADTALVKELMDLMRVFAISAATLVGASVNFVVNREGKVDEAAHSLAEIIRRL